MSDRNPPPTDYWVKKYPTMVYRWDTEGRQRYEVLEFLLHGPEAVAVVMELGGFLRTVKVSELRAVDW